MFVYLPTVPSKQETNARDTVGAEDAIAMALISSVCASGEALPFCQYLLCHVSKLNRTIYTNEILLLSYLYIEFINLMNEGARFRK